MRKPARSIHRLVRLHSLDTKCVCPQIRLSALEELQPSPPRVIGRVRLNPLRNISR